MTRLFSIFTFLLVLMVLTSLPAAAEDSKNPPGGAFSQIFRDGVSGGAVGGLVGLAMLAFVDTPSDHTDYISTGAAVGVLAGVGWGIWRSARTPPYLRPAVMREDGRWHVAVPDPELILSRSPSANATATADATVLWRLAGFRF